ncbi:MAG: dTMP kinase [Elusimicrobiota bacterium]|nr:MAG: dTMP kinase [Elusimicrobiota bacterium]
MPLLILQVSGSVSAAAFAAAASSAVDAAGTLLGGRLTDRFGAKPVLVATTIVRGASVLALPVLAAATGLTVPLVLGAYLVESLARGVADTARNVVPSTIAGGDVPLLKRVLAKNQAYFEAGGIAGPVLAGVLIATAGGAAAAGALWLAPLVFAGTAVAYLGLPKAAAVAAETPAAPAPIAPKKKLDVWTKWALAATALLTLYPLKAVLPAIFATSVLANPASAAWLVALFGVGGLVGSLAYGRLSGKLGLKSFLAAGAAGSAALALAFLPGAFLPAAIGVLAFSAANVAARLSLNAAIQARAPEGKAGAAVGAARFTANLSSLSVRFLAGLAFAAALAPAASFWILGGGILAVAGAQLWTARKLAVLGAAGAVAGLSPVHGLPGRLIVVEGLDGSGKSTQMELLKEELESRGLKVVVTAWNSSEMISDAVRQAKREHAMTPKTFSLLHASDLADRLDKTILPALQEGSIVLADRWFFTALARDHVRGMDRKWLRRLYEFAPRPDLTLYYKLPVATAIGRVLARNEGRLGLSEDAGAGPKYYEAGLDTKLSADPIENFHLFQGKVTAEYDAQAREFGFKTIDSSRTREEIKADTIAAALGALGALSGFKREEKPAVLENLFDKDPSGDAENIRRNYMHEKKGAHFYFRNMLLPMQDRFAQLMDMASTPRAFLHGSPHVDNYAKSKQGAAMVDFDRARVGPYTWDLVRLMVSLSLRAKKEPKGLLDKEALKSLKRGYLRGFRHPDRAISEMRELKDVEPEEHEKTTNAYLVRNKKWAKEMRENPLPADHPDVVALVKSWADGRADGVMNDYHIEEAGRGRGSMGFRGIFLVVLAPNDPRSGLDRMLLNVKATRTDPDTEWYKSPAGSEAERMKAAADLHAPGWELRSGGAVLDGVEYYVRQLDPLNAKLKKMLTTGQLIDLAYAAGTQLGRAHRLSLQGSTPEELEAHLEANYGGIAEAGLVIRDEIVSAHARYLDRMKLEGLTPAGDGEEE